MKLKKIIFVHLLNDYSGSPKVLSQIIQTIERDRYDIELYTGKSNSGFLSNTIQNQHFYFYQRFNNKLLTLITFTLSQIDLFFKLLKYRHEDVVIYINTMLPFGAGVAGKIINKKVIYHIHETSIRPDILKKFLRYVISHTASEIIFVSNSLKESEPFKGIEQKVIYNVLAEEFILESSEHNYKWRDDSDYFNVLMICSLKAYKGVDEFIQIAKFCNKDEHVKFILILNAEQNEIDEYFADVELSENITILTKQINIHPFYQQASLVLNLSRPDQCVETFGLTILEAMSYGIPCIVPPVGGPTELIEKDSEGYLISSYEIDKIALLIKKLSNNKEKCLRLSNNAKIKSYKFNLNNFKKDIAGVFK